MLLPGRMPAYITPEQYEANVARMAANRQTAATPGAPRDGSALLSGLLRCGRCGGHRMTVRYHDGRGSAHGYVCAFEQVNYGTGGSCQHIAGPALDAYVTGQVLEAVAPAALEVSLAAAAQAEAERAMLDKLWRQRIERARYAADRARRQYQLAEPENRLVARQLETDWEAALAEPDRLEADYQRFTEELPKTLTAAERAAIQALASDLPRVWDAPSTTQADRKELLRILIEKITVAVAGSSELVDVTITWAGGHQTTGQAVRPVARLDQLSYYPALLARVTELAEAGRTNRQIAGILNAEGFRPPKRTSRFTGGPGPHPDQPARHPRTRQRRGRPAALSRPAARPMVSPRPVRRAGHAHRHHLQLDLPRMDHRPARSRNQELDHHRRRRADAAATRTQSTPARLLHPRPLDPACTATRHGTRNTAMRKQHALTGTSGGQPRSSAACRRSARSRPGPPPGERCRPRAARPAGAGWWPGTRSPCPAGCPGRRWPPSAG